MNKFKNYVLYVPSQFSLYKLCNMYLHTIHILWAIGIFDKFWDGVFLQHSSVCHLMISLYGCFEIYLSPKLRAYLEKKIRTCF